MTIKYLCSASPLPADVRNECYCRTWPGSTAGFGITEPGPCDRAGAGLILDEASITFGFTALDLSWEKEEAGLS
jgi:hypothetical protein